MSQIGETKMRIAMITPITERRKVPHRWRGGYSEEMLIPPMTMLITSRKIPTRYAITHSILTGTTKQRIPMISAKTPLMRSPPLVIISISMFSPQGRREVHNAGAQYSHDKSGDHLKIYRITRDSYRIP
jgi:hypothetical protein